MRQASKRIPDSAEKTVRDIRRATRRHHLLRGSEMTRWAISGHRAIYGRRSRHLTACSRSRADELPQLLAMGARPPVDHVAVG
jgi:hypothetical protein